MNVEGRDSSGVVRLKPVTEQLARWAAARVSAWRNSLFRTRSPARSLVSALVSLSFPRTNALKPGLEARSAAPERRSWVALRAASTSWSEAALDRPLPLVLVLLFPAGSGRFGAHGAVRGQTCRRIAASFPGPGRSRRRPVATFSPFNRDFLPFGLRASFSAFLLAFRRLRLPVVVFILFL